MLATCPYYISLNIITSSGYNCPLKPIQIPIAWVWVKIGYPKFIG